MNVSQAITNYINYQTVNLGEKTVKNYRLFLSRFDERFEHQDITEVTTGPC